MDEIKKGSEIEDNGFDAKINQYLSGDALLNLCWKAPNLVKCLNSNSIPVFLNEKEFLINGKTKEDYNDIKNLVLSQTESNSSFYAAIINQEILSPSNSFVSYLQLEGPYFFRSSVECLNALTISLKTGHITKMYNYLDAIHLGHAFQQPSEFANIGQRISELISSYPETFSHFSCSRCATARGYFNPQLEKNQPGTLEGFNIVNLNQIIDWEEKPQLALARNCANLSITNTNDVPNSLLDENATHIEIWVFLPHSPYSTEMCFGGISFAVACANHDIPTHVIFIDDGVHAIHRNHQISDTDKIFNIQEIIFATSDMENLHYHVDSESMDERNIQISDNLIDELEIQDHNSLVRLFTSNNTEFPFIQKRCLIF